MNHKSAFSKFIQALNVTNAALEAHRDSITLRPLLSACEADLDRETLGVVVVSKDTNKPVTQVAIRLDRGRFVVESPDMIGDGVDWVVTEEYLDEVITQPTRYFENPDLLQFDWLKRRVGMAT